MEKRKLQNLMRPVSSVKKLSLETGLIKGLKSGFTLVELIVVITILAILATIGFVSFSGYLAGTRDTNRIAQLKSMSDALELYRTKKDLPIPDDKVDVKSGDEVIAYQGDIGKNVLETIEYTESGLDPKYKEYFSYYLTKNKKYFQLMAFLEEENQDTKTEAYSGLKYLNATNYSDKYPFVKGKKLGILTDSENNPIQKIEEITSSGYLDIENTNNTYKAILENGYELTGTGSELKILKGTAWAGGVRNSCKILLEKSSKFKGKDGYYLINQEAPTKVYCDMTTNGGGWTRYINITGDYSLDDAKQCWLAKSNWENAGETIECYNPNRLNFIVSQYMIKQNSQIDGNGIWNKWIKEFKKNYPSMIVEVQWDTNHICKGGQEYMTVESSSSSAPNKDLTNVSYVRLGLSMCNENSGYEIGGKSSADTFINCSNSGKGPSCGSWETHVKPAQMFIK